jgi:hypothetical protein
MTTKMSRLTAILLTLAAASALRPATAHACGGFFCSRPPPDGSLPIAQAGEQVLFVLGNGQVEAHIQIIYKGDAAQFSWVVPVTALPTLDVGTDVMFDRLEAATRPSFQLMWQMDGTCQGFGSQSDGAGCGGASERGYATTTGGGAPGHAVEGPAVEVAFRGNVGPYDSAVIRSDDPMALKTWLTTNGYYVSDQAARVVDDYVAAHSYFVALRLQQGKDTSAIQPIVLRMAGDEGCLPLKLTAVAATPDLRVNVWVLGAARAVPLDYVEVGINQAKLDWFNFGKNYDALLGQAANEAGGNAFSVEYARPARDVAQRFNIDQSQIDTLSRMTDASSYLAWLRTMGFEFTGQVLAVLRKQLPLPADVAARGVTEAQYYASPYTYGGTPSPFDAQATTADLQAAVFGPLAKVQPLFASHAYLTRLATFISPEEMTKDPRFVTNAELPDVQPGHAAVAHMLCGDEDYDVCHAPVRLHLETGVDVNFGVAAGAPAACDSSKTPTYDRTAVDTLPSADVGWLREATGEGHLVVDNRAMITSGLAAQNASVQLSPGGCGCSVRGRARPLAFALAIVALVIARTRRRR